MTHWLRSFIALGAIVLTAGCAHPITIAADASKIESSRTPIQKSVGFYLSAEDRALEVKTPGGGGDQVSYLPYRDLEVSLYKALSVTFTNVTRLNSPAPGDRSVSLVVIPKIVTNSSSESMLTWQPTKFSVELNTRFIDGQGQQIAQTRVTGFGEATFDEFKSDFALAAKRASSDAIKKFMQAIAENDALKR